MSLDLKQLKPKLRKLKNFEMIETTDKKLAENNYEISDGKIFIIIMKSGAGFNLSDATNLAVQIEDNNLIRNESKLKNEIYFQAVVDYSLRSDEIKLIIIKGK